MIKYFQPVFLCGCIMSVNDIEAKEMAHNKERPNILWIIMDDVGIEFPCYGRANIETPNVDRLIMQGTWFSNAFLTAPVSSSSRSAMITGMYQTTIGANNHLSGRGKYRISLPKDIVPVVKIFQENGYHTSNQDYPFKKKKIGKTDYNFDWDHSMYDSNDWSDRKEGQAFFAQVQLHGGKNRDRKNWREQVVKELGFRVDSSIVNLPPYYPNDPVILADWADYLDCIRYTDKLIGQILERLEKEGILDNTFIILMGDNGVSHARGKQFLYDEGIRTLFVIRGPGVAQRVERKDLIEHIDMAATSLEAAGIDIPIWMQGKNVFSKDYEQREFVYAARDRCGETIDRIRSVRSDRYKYIRNYFPELPILQPSNYKDRKKIIIRLRELHQSGKLSEEQNRLLFSKCRPKEEFYDLKHDPFEMCNQINNVKYKKEVGQFRSALKQWSIDTKDPFPESLDRYIKEMDFQLENTKDLKGKLKVAANIHRMKEWLTHTSNNKECSMFDWD